MSGEWLKSSLAELIQAYKQYENLYNQKHKLYYNKQARNHSLQKILTEVKVSWRLVDAVSVYRCLFTSNIYFLRSEIVQKQPFPRS